MKKKAQKIAELISIFMILASVFCLFTIQGTAASDTPNTSVIYIADGGNGDGTSAASPLGNLLDATATINAASVADSSITGGKIVLAGNVTIPATTTLKNTVPLTITSADKANFKLMMGGHISLNGATGGIYFTNIEITINKKDMTVFGHGNKIVMGAKGVEDDVIITTAEGVTGALYLVPGGNGTNVPKVDLEINSGTYSKVNMVGYSGGNVNGDVNYVINGGKIMTVLAIGSDGRSSTVLGKTNVVINDGIFDCKIYLGHAIVDYANVFEDDVTLKINGGTFNSTIVPHTGAGTIAFDKKCVIDISDYTGYTDLDFVIGEDILADSQTFTINRIPLETEPPATTIPEEESTAPEVTTQVTDSDGNEITNTGTTAADVTGSTNPKHTVIIAIVIAVVVLCGGVIFFVLKNKKTK